ncbi:LLM class flavin-dependent oxidoreductase [Pseudonocardia abyssalis]|uniref:LLM class flavin-dependent oxidoreductase n=1 Tax=Pseudonocardia abyssalis TaxID=2792008 RepID=A0ABS6UPB0_9PSEU|nr:LLM class flavin-dependent oxidoreductase [Pseudonocardia abyssalis]MBW0118482.1 LLM class flavin-dependent oxidoreductase [Pseudonocardia abyssalis]MBW0134012.1 LLM class flavin-dependent oxidoreductase [Pseudonocardia abyssalis]
MRIGAFLLAAGFPGRTHADVLDSCVATAVAAEEAGFDDVWVAEHHFMSYGLVPSAITMAGYLLGATSRIAVGTAVSVLSTTHPVALAEQALLLDQVSRGRFRLGVGRGGPWVDLEVFGTGTDRVGDGFAESLDLLLRALRGGPVAAAGERFAFREVDVVPAPHTAPHPPVVLAVTSPQGRALAAAHGLPMLLGMHADDVEKAAFVRGYPAAVPDGRVPGAAGTGCGIGARGHVSVAVAHVEDTTAGAQAVLREALPRWLGPGLAGHRRVDDAPHRPRDPVAYTDLLCRLHAVGTPDDAVARLAGSAARTGIDHVLLMVEGSGDRGRVLENVRRLGAEVLPRLRRVRPAG